jgi:hypothetical protein
MLRLIVCLLVAAPALGQSAGQWDVKATIKDGTVSAKVPADRPIVYYLAVVDARGVEVSTPHQENE